jgi:ABC-type glycerol-3-phosphate transport system substrate-binding protein
MKIRNILLILMVAFICTSCSTRPLAQSPNHPIEITYWQYWTGFEGKAIEKLVDKFNKTHSNIKVKMLTISEPRKKMLLSIIGGTPPDVISTIGPWVPELASKGALIPLDNYCTKHKITKDLFFPSFWEMLNLYGHTWALPTTPTATALYWNKDLFKEAGLDPEKPPKTLKELKEYSNKITSFENGKIKRIGFLPSWPLWTCGIYGLVFGGSWGKVEGKKETFSANDPKNIEAWEWTQGFVENLGGENVQTFQEEFGNFQGPNNPFYTGMIAIEINGTWEGNFISKFAPKIKWGAAPIPTNKDGSFVTTVNCDCLVIPRGSKHPDEAFEFIAWLMKPENLEELCIEQKKFSPLIYSDREDFITNHPHPYIKVFIDSVKSKNAQYFPQTVLYQQYERELKREFEGVMKLQTSPKDALNRVQNKMQSELKRVSKY